MVFARAPRSSRGFFAFETMFPLFETLFPLALVATYFVFGSTTGFGLPFGTYDQQRVAQIGLLGLVFASRGLHLARPSGCAFVFSCGKVPAVSLIFLAAWGALSSLAAAQPKWALLEWALFVSLTFFAAAIASIRSSETDSLDKAILGIVVMAAAVYVVATFSAYLATVFDGTPLLVWELFGGFSNIRFFGQYQSLTLPLVVLPLLLYKLSNGQRLLLMLLCSVWWTFAIATGTRGTWLGMMVASAVAIYCGSQGRKWVAAQVRCFLMGFAIYILLFDIVPDYFGIQSITIVGSRFADIASLSKRDLLWTAAAGFVREHPFWGVGPMHFAHFPNDIGAHPHNSLLQLAAEWGVPVALAVLVIALRAVYAMVGTVRQTIGVDPSKSLLMIGLIASIVAAMAQSLVDGVIVMPFTQTVLAFVSGWALGVYRSLSGRRVLPKSNWEHLALFLLGTMAIGLMYSLLAPELWRLGEWERSFLDRHVGVPCPRFWAQGWIYD